jgi:hypothetical protein
MLKEIGTTVEQHAAYVARFEQEDREAAHQAGFITADEWREMGSPVNYSVNFEPADGERSDWRRAAQPVDILRGFFDWLSGEYSDTSQLELRHARNVRINRPTVATWLDAGPFAAPFAVGSRGYDEEACEGFASWVQGVFWIDETASERAELYALMADGETGGDLCGDFDFTSEVTLRWFERFLESSKYDGEKWRLCNFTYADLIAVASPDARDGEE